MASLDEFKGEAPAKPKGFPALLEAYKPQIAAALPKHLNADRMARIALTCYRQTPKLAECDPVSVFAAVIQAAQLGLEPGLNGRAYIIPYGNQATFVPGWKGLVELGNRSGRANIYSGVIYADQKHEFLDGSTRSLRILNDTQDDTPENITHAYAVGRIKGMEDFPIIELWSVGRITRHRDRYNKVGKRHYSFDNMEMYARKVVVLQVLKYLPSTPELEAAIILNDAAEVGRQNLTVKDAIEGTFTAVAEDPKAPEAPLSQEAGLASGSGASGGGGTTSITPEDAFALADDACKNKKWDEARDLMRSCTDADRKIIASKLPKETK